MDYIYDYYIKQRLHEHLLYYTENYEEDWFVICLYGSQNYGIYDVTSDIDSRILVVPSLEDIALNRKPISHTLKMPDNGEHIDCKDVREYLKILRKSNLNFVEILFTSYYIVNNKYYDLWNRLLENAEDIANINPYAAVSCIKGMANQKYRAMFLESPVHIAKIKEFGYDPKQLSHLFRIRYFLRRYVEGKPYKDCIYPKNKCDRNVFLECKRNGWGLNKEEAKIRADAAMEDIMTLADTFQKICPNRNDLKAEKLLDEISCDLIRRSIVKGE
jgi:predicted nucleotidyltransferase